MTILVVDLATAADISRRVRRKDVSPLEVIDHALARIAARDPSLNTFVHLDPDGARAAARTLENRIMRGEDVGPLAGVPTAIKDLFMTYPGWPMTFGGIPAFRAVRGAERSHYARRMEAAGAIVVGATNSPVFGFRGTCDNPLFGPTRNPFDLARNSGGSSGGSAAAVADGLLTIGGANDGGGSIRIPSAWCGTFGFQPSFGRLPQHGFDIAPFVYEGVITRTVEDAALALHALAGLDRGDPFGNPAPVDWTGARGASVRGLRIGYAADLGGFPVRADVAGQVDRVVRALGDAGAEIVPVEVRWPCPHHAMTELWCRLVGLRMAGALETFAAMGVDLRRDHRADLPTPVWRWIDVAEGLSPADVRRDVRLRGAIHDALQHALAAVDLIACPTVACPAVDNRSDGETVGPDRIGDAAVDPLIGWCLTYPTNLAGNPSASLPAGLAEGLPVGLQLIGQRFGDAELLSACLAYEQVRPWRTDYLVCAQRPLTPSASRVQAMT